MIRDDEHADDEQRELAEYTVGDDVGFVRLAVSGALAVRELGAAGAGPLHRLRTTIRRDDDVVAVDASPRTVVIVYTEEVEPGEAGAGTDPAEPVAACTRVAAVRVDRKTFDESVVELSRPRCGHELGPFFTSAVGDAVSVAWPERTGGAGEARAPIVGLAHLRVMPTGTPELGRVAHAAESIVDAGCGEEQCWAVALGRGDTPKVLRYR